jgi:hypothetical protein
MGKLVVREPIRQDGTPRDDSCPRTISAASAARTPTARATASATPATSRSAAASPGRATTGAGTNRTDGTTAGQAVVRRCRPQWRGEQEPAADTVVWGWECDRERQARTETGRQLDLTSCHGPLDSGGGQAGPKACLAPEPIPRAWTNVGEDRTEARYTPLTSI